MGANERESDTKVRVVLIEFYSFKMLLDTLVNFVGDLSRLGLTAFSGRKRKSLKISMKSVPKGMISMMARM